MNLRSIPQVFLAFCLALFSAGTARAAFIENQGQWSPPAKYLWRGGALAAWFEADGVSLVLRSGGAGRRGQSPQRCEEAAVRLAFEGASEGASEGAVIEAENRQRGTYSFFVGNDRSRWRSGVPGYGGLAYRGLYDCIEMRMRESTAGGLEYDFHLEAGADLAQVVVRFDGVLGLELEGDGTLVILTPLGELRSPPPLTWQEGLNGERHAVSCRYRILDDTRYAFEAEGADAALALVIDPLLVWAAFPGGSGYDLAWDVEVLPDGDVVIVGATGSADFQRREDGCTPYDVDYNGGALDAFVARLDGSTGEILATSYLGGAGDEQGLALSLTSLPHVTYATVSGTTTSSDFPITNDSALAGGRDGFVARLDDSLCTLVFSTYLGGEQEDAANSVAEDGTGAVVAAGWTASADFPTTPGAFQEGYGGGGYDAFVCRIVPDQGPGLSDQLAFSSFLGGVGDEAPCCGDQTFFDRLFTGGLALEPDGTAVLVGRTSSFDFPVTEDAYQASLAGAHDAYLTRLHLDATTDRLQQVLYSTFYGGNGVESAESVALAPDGSVWVAGFTASQNLPTTPAAHQRTSRGFDPFIAHFDWSREGEAQLVYATYHGGTGVDLLDAVVVNPSGRVTIAGQTQSPDFPVTKDAFDGTHNGAGDGYLVQIENEELSYATFVGGSNHDECVGLALGLEGDLIVVGFLESSSLDGVPVSPRAAQEAFVLRFERPEEPRFLRGDTDADGALTITDPIVALGYLFVGGRAPSCLKTADADDSGTLEITDGILVLGYLFLGGNEPAAPFPQCGPDLSPDGLSCVTNVCE